LGKEEEYYARTYIYESEDKNESEEELEVGLNFEGDMESPNKPWLAWDTM
jgi:hypothetical protein